MQKIHKYTHSEWNQSRDVLVDKNLIHRVPTVGYYLANKFGYIYYDTESFGIDVFDAFKKNPDAMLYIKEGVLKILGKISQHNFYGNWFSLNIEEIPISSTEDIANEIYEFLLEFEMKFINPKN